MPAGTGNVNVTANWMPLTIVNPPNPQFQYIPDNTGGGQQAAPSLNLTPIRQPQGQPAPNPTSVTVGGLLTLPASVVSGIVQLTIGQANQNALPDAAIDYVLQLDLSRFNNVHSVSIPSSSIRTLAMNNIALEVTFPNTATHISTQVLANIASNFGGANTIITVDLISRDELTSQQSALVPAAAVLVRIAIRAGNNYVRELHGIMSTTVPFAGPAPAAAWRVTTQLEPITVDFNAAIHEATLHKTQLSIFAVATDTTGGGAGAGFITQQPEPPPPPNGFDNGMFDTTPPIAPPPPPPPVNLPPPVPILRLTIGSTVYSHFGAQRHSDAAPFIDERNDRTMVPLRIVAEGLGAEVEWIAATETGLIHRGTTTLSLRIGQELPGGLGAAQIVNYRTFVPARYITEYLGGRVEWDSFTRTVYIFAN
jgi:hypothetical protein